MNKKRAYYIYDTLKTVIERPVCELNYETPFELLIAVILSARCTDKRVNSITPILFKNYNTPQAIANMDTFELENIIRPCGFFKTKAEHIKTCAKQIVQDYGGKVPTSIDELTKLSGVGRKTANVVQAVAFKIPALAVDTHVQRVSKRLGLSDSDNVYDTEMNLKSLYDSSDWSLLHHTLLLFGRYYCKSRHPKCEICKLKEICKYYKGI